MPGLKICGLRMERPGAAGERAIKRRRACPAKRTSAKQGRADGSSACPGGSPHEPGGVSTKATIPGDMQQTGQIHRVRNAGVYLLLWPAAPTSSHAVCSFSRSSGCPVPHGAGRHVVHRRVATHGAAGAAKRPAFRTPLGGRKARRQRKCGLPRAERRTGAISHVCTRGGRGWAV